MKDTNAELKNWAAEGIRQRIRKYEQEIDALKARLKSLTRNTKTGKPSKKKNRRLKWSKERRESFSATLRLRNEQRRVRENNLRLEKSLREQREHEAAQSTAESQD